MLDKRALRAGGWCGIAFSALSLIVIPLTATPSTGVLPALGTSPEDFAAWYSTHKMGFLVGNYLGIAAFVPGFVQLAILYAVIRAKEKEPAFLAPFVLASGTFTYAVFACSLVAFQALPFLTDPYSPPAMMAMGTLGSIWFALDGLAAIPFLLAVGWATLATGALPRWFASVTWVTIAFAILMSLGAIWDEPRWLAAGSKATLLGFFVFFVWTTVLSVLFLQRRE